MLKFAFLVLLSASSCFGSAGALIVVGAPGEDEFGEMFDDWAQLWKDACAKADVKVTLVGGTTNDFELVRTNLAQAAANPTDEFWLVLLGHGTFDGADVDGSDLFQQAQRGGVLVGVGVF